jgi:hypothetical protein
MYPGSKQMSAQTAQQTHADLDGDLLAFVLIKRFFA